MWDFLCAPPFLPSIQKNTGNPRLVLPVHNRLVSFDQLGTVNLELNFEFAKFSCGFFVILSFGIRSKPNGKRCLLYKIDNRDCYLLLRFNRFFRYLV